MTEDEATTRWCPFSRVLAQTYTQQGEFRVSTGYSYNRTPDDEENYFSPATNCVGSACMAWRGKVSTEFSSRADTSFRRDGARLTPAPADIEGWCGLASPIQ